MKARWMDPGTGRFISPDPAKDGLNWYVYCSNNPTTMVDPSGLLDENGDPNCPEDYEGLAEDVANLPTYPPYAPLTNSDYDGDGITGDLGDSIIQWKMDHGVYEQVAAFNALVAGLSNKQEEYGIYDQAELTAYLNLINGVTEMLMLKEFAYGKGEYNNTESFDVPLPINGNISINPIPLVLVGSQFGEEGSILSWLLDPSIRNSLFNPFPTESRFGFVNGNSNLNGSVDFQFSLQWTPEGAIESVKYWDELMNSTWDGTWDPSQFIVFPELSTNGLCWVSDMIRDSLKIMDETRTVGQVRDIMLNLAKDEEFIRGKNAGALFGYLTQDSGIVHNKIWELLENTTGTWSHYRDFNLENMVDKVNTFGYVNAPFMYDKQHWVSIISLNYGNIITYKSGDYLPQTSRGIVSVVIYDPAAHSDLRIQTIPISYITNEVRGRIRAVYTP